MGTSKIPTEIQSRLSFKLATRRHPRTDHALWIQQGIHGSLWVQGGIEKRIKEAFKDRSGPLHSRRDLTLGAQRGIQGGISPLASRRHLRTDLALCIQGGIQGEITPFGLKEAFKDRFEFKEAFKEGSRPLHSGRHSRRDLTIWAQTGIQGGKRKSSLTDL